MGDDYDEYMANLEELKPQYRQFAVTSEPRRGGKVMTRVLHGASFDPGTRTYRLADGAKLTEAELQRLPQQQLNLIANRVDTVLRNQQGRQPSALTTNPATLKDHTTIRWQESGRFTYVALWVEATQRWYISGSGAHYGGNELTHYQVLEVLARVTATNLEVATDWIPLQ